MKYAIEKERWLTEHLKKINMSDREIMDENEVLNANLMVFVIL